MVIIIIIHGINTSGLSSVDLRKNLIKKKNSFLSIFLSNGYIFLHSTSVYYFLSFTPTILSVFFFSFLSPFFLCSVSFFRLILSLLLSLSNFFYFCHYFPPGQLCYLFYFLTPSHTFVHAGRIITCVYYHRLFDFVFLLFAFLVCLLLRTPQKNYQKKITNIQKLTVSFTHNPSDTTHRSKAGQKGNMFYPKQMFNEISLCNGLKRDDRVRQTMTSLQSKSQAEANKIMRQEIKVNK